jgi:hypothetical protein
MPGFFFHKPDHAGRSEFAIEFRILAFGTLIAQVFRIFQADCLGFNV